MNFNKQEKILMTIDKLGVVTVKQLHEILKLGSYRYTCKVIHELEEFLHVVRSNQKIVYLNKDGRNLIGSDKEVKKSLLFDHMLLCNQAYVYYNCPLDWKREFAIETSQEPEYSFGIQIKGLTVVNKKTLIPDAVFSRNGYVYLIEIDNTRAMPDNRKKIAKYREMWQEIAKYFGMMPKLCIFTLSDQRKREFEQLCTKMPVEILTFNET
ncbi:replication-relaxation family protein [Cytobacillus sp. Sa5YUA1]|uniref:Replication-relaxation family protein n=1 Tax=Cytobacillus stercorigallinarum TaxID=2762240 RepID=A0ABR8QNJ4_9BACI|nr:replication-relaxation family protein [Cytobacillus stercorigallinarum]MBD7937113.1 replication-relaxation family protein [Cytobacillus stercorigallinarum]